jgi:hypothetical protein
MTVSSGNGWHLWYPVQPLSGADLDASAAPAAYLMREVGSDNMADLPRVIRLPFTINVPTTSKRRRGARLAFAQPTRGPPHVVQPLPLPELLATIRKRAGVSRRPDQTPFDGAEPVAPFSTALPPDLLRAPSGGLLRAAVDQLPNTDRMDRKF